MQKNFEIWRFSFSLESFQIPIFAVKIHTWIKEQIKYKHYEENQSCRSRLR